MITRNFRLLRKLNLSSQLLDQLNNAELRLTDQNVILPVVDNTDTEIKLHFTDTESDTENCDIPEKSENPSGQPKHHSGYNLRPRHAD